MKDGRIIVFTCNWDSYAGLENAGNQGLTYPPAVIPIRVPCLGCLHPGIILKAFERGASGVLLLGCAAENCHYQFGRRQAESVVNTSVRLLNLLGLDHGALRIQTITTDDGSQWVETVTSFLNEIECIRRFRTSSCRPDGAQ